MTYNVHAGHGAQDSASCGAVGYFAESVEDRKVKDKVISKLRGQGHSVYDCTVDYGANQNDILNKIVAKCNSHSVDYDISIHFNSFNGEAQGVEVLLYDLSNPNLVDIANRICNSIAELGFTNRGVKVNKGLAVLSRTKAPAMLIECCFCDNKGDADRYDAESMSSAIIKGLTGQVAPQPQPTPQPQQTFNPHVLYRVYAEGRGWLDEVIDTTDYAGIKGRAIKGVMVRVTEGSVKYRVHIKGGNWLPYVTGYSVADANNGYAGTNNLGKDIDAIEIYYFTPQGKPYKKARYQVSPVNGNYYPAQYDNDTLNGQDGYAGVIGKSIDRLLVSLVD